MLAAQHDNDIYIYMCVGGCVYRTPPHKYDAIQGKYVSEV